MQNEYYVFRYLALQGISKTDLQQPFPKISDETKDNVERKINKISLNDYFVILAPEANASFPPPVEFWNKIVAKFNYLGIDVFLNYINDNNWLSECKSPSRALLYDEIYELACRAQAVITLKSGFSEIVLPSRTPVIEVITCGLLGPYNPSRDAISAENRLCALPYVRDNDIRAIYYFKYESNEDAADAVLSCYKEMMKNRSYVN